MFSFIIGTVVGGCAAVFFMTLISAKQKSDTIESDYYKNRLLRIADKIKPIVGRFHNSEITADDAINQIEKELKL